MKCPESYKVIQQNLRQTIFDEDNIERGEYNLSVETQEFENCFKEKCAAWDSKKNRCRKVGK